MTAAHRLAVAAVFALLIWLLALMVTAPVQDAVDRITPATAAPPVTLQGDPNG